MFIRAVVEKEYKDWDSLIDCVWHHRSLCLECKGGKGAIKPFSIKITYTSRPARRESSSKKDSKKAPDAGLKGKDGDAPVKEHELLRQLEKCHMCAACGRPCYILSNGDHHQYTVQEMLTWVFLLSRHQAVLERPLEELKLEDVPMHQKKKAATMAATPAPPAVDLSMQMMNMMGTFMASLAGNMAMGQVPNQLPMTPACQPLAAVPNTVPITPTPPTPAAGAPSTATTAPAGEEALYNPDLETWMCGLDDHTVHGSLKLNYNQHTPALRAEGILQLSDLYNLCDVENNVIVLHDLSGGSLNYGTAKRLLVYVEEDY
ncbi:uncharacterized protein LACBIDRAFT_328141 [Laccaria bicolor S238N-H82]|uniref:Predicted protein n=1 Tax=Laccaria bicolor (strain S238N-H82 / ATCC MYA-4686) TaxID=486041 RepID=B0DDV9_LACBS|nr:uncharacterized protein LACBIDRAFT_328141 [Laccaria bicolor S238N-H82]EDR07285.1 predicted protein [Laccaria bicolor S238N-H82]|eukprot:XP_001882216.1 predicted protein [Laccaria bicolor S238N-H82]